ncbi:MAG: 50S ribosomal protein L31 [Coriobacteriia bacterium]|nr:50S ribosomal protein L31 [Coriobacteriia bacterium]
MRSGIHPDYKATNYSCSCGNAFESHSTKGGDVRIELCNKCHPFFTGTQKFVDTGGRVQRFADKFGAAATATLEKEKAAVDARRAAAEEEASKKAAVREERAAAKAARAAEFEKVAPAKKEVVADEAEEQTPATTDADAETKADAPADAAAEEAPAA